MKTCRAMRLDYAPWIRATTQSVEFNLWRGARHVFTHRRHAIAHMVSRPDFDNALVEQNRLHPGLALHCGERVVDATYNGAFTVHTSKRSVRAPQLVAADGAYSTINRIFGVARPQAMAVAIEVNIARDAVQIEREPLMCFDFGAIESGYGWVFPKDDHWSVGLYTYSRGLKGLRSRLREYVEAKGLLPRVPSAVEFEAHQVPVGGYRLAVRRAPVYVVGDAGGFADALTGEGIYHAVESGRLAGETASVVHSRGAAADSAGYRRRLWRSVLPDTAFTYHASRLFYAHLRAGIGSLAAPGVWRVLIEGYADSATTTRTIARAPLYAARSLLGGTVSHDRAGA